MAGPVRRTSAQLQASDPGANVWVSASAGTGKTHVLTDRILRLMLAGSAPERILALTFTRAAAAEMQNRVIRRLGEWQGMTDDRLAAELQALDVVPDADALLRARQLFARALNVPGGLRIHTLHGFAQGLLASFPLEAGMAPGFSALEERDARQMKQRALLDCITDAQQADDKEFLQDLAELSVAKGESGLTSVLDVMLNESDALLNFTDPRGLQAAIWGWLNVDIGEQPGEYLQQFLQETFDEALVRTVVEKLKSWGKQTGQARSAQLEAWLARDQIGRIAHFVDLCGAVFTQEWTPRRYAANEKTAPGLHDANTALAEHLMDPVDRGWRLQTAELAARALMVGHRIAMRYAALKRAAMAVDFADMIIKTVDLLGPAGMPDYVGWKLDSRFDHILVDEAQDTNARQWKIIDRLAEDFFTGEQERARSIFVVGDHKQSIYSFQGTDPKLFEDWRARTAPQAEAIDQPLQEAHLALNFRSGPAVLQLVNAFLDDAGPEAIGLSRPAPPHEPHRADAAGEVVLWPVIEVEADTEDDEQQTAGSEEAARQMARRLAEQVATWLTPEDPERLWLPAHGRWARPGDILILLRHRTMLMGSLVQELHDLDVQVAGVDRLLLTEPLAVLDLLALVRFAVQPEDDLNLACLLVSPFLGWAHEDIRQLTHGRKGLWAALGRARDDEWAAQARGWLGQVLNLADRIGPYEFLDTILSGPLDGRRKLVARLGTQANDPINELLQQALDYESRNAPALAGFLSWIEAEGAAVKRDADAASDQVRLMTVHGSKGLESPVVVMADSATKRSSSRSGHVLVDIPGAGRLPVFHPPSKQGLPQQLAVLRDAEDVLDEAEDLRLLYVALTRAADHLFIGGARAVRPTKSGQKPKEDKPVDNWHDRLQPIFAALSGVEQPDSEIWGEGVRRLRVGNWDEPSADAAQLAISSARHVLDDLHVSLAPPPEYPPRPLVPSAMPEAPPEGPAVEARRRAALRGKLIHRLFERLPAVPPDQREGQALSWLKAQGAEDGTAIWQEVARVMDDPDLALLFGPDALAEAPVTGLIGPQVVSGIIDRMVILPDRILLVDFKTGARVPQQVADVPLAYRKQMAAYAEVLQRAFPTHRIEAALLYTSAPRLLRLSPEDLAGLLSVEGAQIDA